MHAWLDRLADMGLDADVACWSVRHSTWAAFYTKAGYGYGNPRGSGWGTGLGYGYNTASSVLSILSESIGYEGYGDGPSQWRRESHARLLSSAMGEQQIPQD